MNKNYILLFITSLVITNCSFSQSWNWAEGNSGVNVQLNCAATSRNPWQWFGYACGVNGTVIKTTNWGIQWQNISGTIPSNII
jgi:hypothetical protein